MSFKNVTLPQALILIALLAAVIATYKLFGEGAGAVMLGIQGAFTFFMGRNNDPPPPNDGQGGSPNLKLVAGGAAGTMLLLCACGSFVPDPKDVKSDEDKAVVCRAEARSAHYVDQKSVEESMAIFHACMKREGLE